MSDLSLQVALWVVVINLWVIGWHLGNISASARIIETKLEALKGKQR